MLARRFRWFRALLGGYLGIHFLQLVPWSAELFSHRGVFPEPGVLPLAAVPGLLALNDSPAAARGLLAVLTGAAIAFAVGRGRRLAALVLWAGWASLFLRNPLIANPSIPYVGLLLLVTLLVPTGEGGAGRDPDPAWRFPRAAHLVVWVALAAGYTYSGLDKLGAPSWRDGTAFLHLLENPLARPGPIRELLLQVPLPGLRALTWSALAIEIAAAPLALFRRGRALAWLLLTGLQVGILSVVAFADLTAGMLLAHLFVLDPGGLRALVRRPGR